MQQDWSIIFQSRNRQACSDRALVLHSVSIPCEVLADEISGFSLVVPEAVVEKAKFEIWEFEQENALPAAVPIKLEPDYRRAIPGVIGYLIVVLVFGWMSGQDSFGIDWAGAGRVDGTLIRNGEWWRTVTALTLHGSIRHILGNMVFGLLFGILAGGFLGPGFVWFCIVLAGALGNALNVILLDAAHRSIGASTAVFAALGIISGFVWRARLMAQDRWAWRLGPIVGGIALLAYTGTGDENTDVGAHLAGFACGFIAGLVVARMPDTRANDRFQMAAGGAALAIVVGSWLAALHVWN